MKTVKFAAVAASLLVASALSSAAFAGAERLTPQNRDYFGGTILNAMPEAAPAEAPMKHGKHHGKHHAGKAHGKKHGKKKDAAPTEEKK